MMKEDPVKATNLFLASVLGAATLGMAGCHRSLAPSEPLSELNPQQLRGHLIYQQECASCHYANQQGSLHGPGLEGVFRKPYLPSGLPATDQHVEQTIVYGRNMMPGFGNALDPQQINDLLAYLHTL